MGQVAGKVAPRPPWACVSALPAGLAGGSLSAFTAPRFQGVRRARRSTALASHLVDQGG